jgi:SAM-dependent methyltransferase
VLDKNRHLARDYLDKVGDHLGLGLGPDAHLLEIGGAHGFFCALTRDRFGCLVSLVEPGDVPARFAAEKLLINTFHGRMDHYQPPEPVDVIFCGHVCEHLPDPNALLTRCAAWLKPGGRLVLLCPNGRSWKFCLFRGGWAWALPEQHVTFFTPQALNALAARHGFAITHCSSHIPHPIHYPGLLIGVSFWIKNHLKRRHYLARAQRPVGLPPDMSSVLIPAVQPSAPSRLIGLFKRVHRGLRWIHRRETRLTRSWDHRLARRAADAGRPTMALDELCVVLKKSDGTSVTQT